MKNYSAQKTSHFRENNFAKSSFTTATMKIMIHKEKISQFTIHWEKRADLES